MTEFSLILAITLLLAVLLPIYIQAAIKYRKERKWSEWAYTSMMATVIAGLLFLNSRALTVMYKDAAQETMVEQVQEPHKSGVRIIIPAEAPADSTARQ
jgi:hypothetical protein